MTKRIHHEFELSNAQVSSMDAQADAWLASHETEPKLERARAHGKNKEVEKVIRGRRENGIRHRQPCLPSPDGRGVSDPRPAVQDEPRGKEKVWGDLDWLHGEYHAAMEVDESQIRARICGLKPRDRLVAELLLDGKSVQQVAEIVDKTDKAIYASVERSSARIKSAQAALARSRARGAALAGGVPAGSELPTIVDDGGQVGWDFDSEDGGAK